jgi:hypothetical protein
MHKLRVIGDPRDSGEQGAGVQELMIARSHYFGTGKPTRLTIYEDHVELLTVNGPVKRDDQRVRYEQVAQVYVRRGWVFSDLVRITPAAPSSSSAYPA